MKELEITGSLDLVTLHVEGADGSLGPALDSTASVEEALRNVQNKSKIRLVVKVAAGSPVAVADHAGFDLAAARGKKLLDAMLTAEPEPIPGSTSGAKLIRLPGGVEWPQLDAGPLFVRHFYKDCVEGAMSNLTPGRRFIIRGNAGIGKSAFGLYIMWAAVRAKRTVVYVTDKHEFSYIFHPDGRVDAFHRFDFRRGASYSMQDPHTVVVFDGDGDLRAPPIVPATTVLVTSPKLSRYKEFERTGVFHLVFPVFSRNEIGDMLEACFPNLHTPKARQATWKRYERWGGIPRYVLDTSDQEKLENALTGMDLDKLANVIDCKDIEDDSAVHHLKPRGETESGFVGGRDRSAYELDRTELGSHYIAKQVYTAMRMRRSNKLMERLGQPIKGTQLSKFFGDVFQHHALARLQEGGTFETYALGSAEPDVARTGEVFLPSSQVMYFSKCEELAAARVGGDLADRSICVPEPGNYASVDVILPCQRPANFTSASHALLLYAKNDTQGLVPVATALGIAGGRIPFYWIVPQDHYEDIRRNGGKPFPVYLRGAALDAPVRSLATAKPRRGRPRKVAAGVSVAARELLADYQRRIDQFLTFWSAPRRSHQVNVNVPPACSVPRSDLLSYMPRLAANGSASESDFSSACFESNV